MYGFIPPKIHANTEDVFYIFLAHVSTAPLAHELIPLKLEIGIAFCESFGWSDTILMG